MEKRNIQIDIDTARKWYKGGDKSLKILAEQAFTTEELEEPKLPKSWEEFINIKNYPLDFIIYEKTTTYNKLDSLSKLLILRDVYRQGWKPDYKKFTEVKYTIVIDNGSLKIIEHYSGADLFNFPTKELAQQFLENFKDELEQLKELL